MRPLAPCTAALSLAVALAVALACTDRARQSTPDPTEPSAVAAAAPALGVLPAADPARLEALARRMAVALRDAGFRARIKRELDGSPVVEHKLHFQRLLARGGGAVGRELARLNGETAATLTSTAAAVAPLEMYFPVPAHRVAWTGGPDLLVATAVKDGDVPVAFDPAGRRVLLDPRHPPATPVLAIEPVETDFDAAATDLRPAQTCVPPGCGSGDGSAAPTPGLYLTASHLNDTFEGWLKGSPEIEVLVLGQKGATDSLAKYQCAGERVTAPYAFNQDGKDWSGSVLLFSQAQLDAYKAAHPGQAIRLFFMEDDDTACELKQDNSNISALLGAVDGATRGLSGGKDSTTNVFQKLWKFVSAAQKIWTVAASFLKSNDDMIGNAVEDVTVGEFHPGYNWILRGQGNITNGYVNLQLR